MHGSLICDSHHEKNQCHCQIGSLALSIGGTAVHQTGTADAVSVEGSKNACIVVAGLAGRVSCSIEQPGVSCQCAKKARRPAVELSNKLYQRPGGCVSIRGWGGTTQQHTAPGPKDLHNGKRGGRHGIRKVTTGCGASMAHSDDLVAVTAAVLLGYSSCVQLHCAN
jgi:hypothetical protein